MALIYRAVTNELDARKEPFAQPNAGDSIGWWASTPSPYKFRPYLVRWRGRNGNTLTFRFLDCETGREMGRQSHTVDLRNPFHVHADEPTSVHKVQAGGGADCGFLFLSDAYAATTGDDARNSKGGDGKWPDGAASTFMLALRKVVSLLPSEQKANLTPQERDAINQAAEAEII